ncbi:pentapeptide repeat-containing protein [uncultured Megasphaera sp.]|uniref:pentapeptide repeat-containing protein n=1 Tax=uncultured Megasphaera sp. TaxID=165188 RepID=UPI0025985EE8|nr:pentapeptide repeat-containing protein [uncultured Megasphaera sp.]
MREITQEEINAKVKDHELWLDTNGNQGEQAVFTNVSITNKNFSHRNLLGAVFENVEVKNTDFRKTNLSSTRFKNVHFHHVFFNDAILTGIKFWYCNITNTAYFCANLKNAAFTNTTLINVDFRGSNLRYTNFFTAKIENIFVTNAIPMNVLGQRVICMQVNTSRRNNLIAYWAGLGIWTTGCFQGTLEKLREAVAKTHRKDPFLRARYERAINYILEEDKADKEMRIKKEST